MVLVIVESIPKVLINWTGHFNTRIRTNAWFKRMFWNHIFCPIVLYTKPGKAICVFTHLHRAIFLPFDIKTIAWMRQKPQHVRNISSDAPYMLTFLCSIGHWFYIKQQNVAQRKWGETHPAQLEFVYHTIAENTWSQNMLHAFEPDITQNLVSNTFNLYWHIHCWWQYR